MIEPRREDAHGAELAAFVLAEVQRLGRTRVFTAVASWPDRPATGTRLLARHGFNSVRLGVDFRGLMPNPKTGTVTPDVKTAIRETKAGKVEYRVDKTGVIHTAVGKISFDENKIAENTRALIEAVVKAKPSTAKGKYMKKVNLAATMSPGVLLDETAFAR